MSLEKNLGSKEETNRNLGTGDPKNIKKTKTVKVEGDN